MNRYAVEPQVVESVGAQGLEIATEVTISWGPLSGCSSGDGEQLLPRRVPTVSRDWASSHDHPAFFDDLAIQSQLRHRFSLFGLSRDADTQTANRAVNIQIA